MSTQATSSRSTSSPPARSWATAMLMATRWSMRVRTDDAPERGGPLDGAAVVEELDAGPGGGQRLPHGGQPVRLLHPQLPGVADDGAAPRPGWRAP